MILLRGIYLYNCIDELELPLDQNRYEESFNNIVVLTSLNKHVGAW
jgi:hypothetical protein